jgi:hypothetical protein
MKDARLTELCSEEEEAHTYSDADSWLVIAKWPTRFKWYRRGLLIVIVLTEPPSRCISQHGGTTFVSNPSVCDEWMRHRRKIFDEVGFEQFHCERVMRRVG